VAARSSRSKIVACRENPTSPAGGALCVSASNSESSKKATLLDAGAEPGGEHDIWLAGSVERQEGIGEMEACR
jgi:hypothetical protein